MKKDIIKINHPSFENYDPEKLLKGFLLNLLPLSLINYKLVY
jgi:hypothetical protein